MAAARDGDFSSTSTWIAKKLIWFFAVGLFLSFIAAVGVPLLPKEAQKTDQAWLEIYKSGFLLLTGGLSTIIGYFFGSRDSAVAKTLSERERVVDELKEALVSEQVAGPEVSEAAVEGMVEANSADGTAEISTKENGDDRR